MSPGIESYKNYKLGISAKILSGCWTLSKKMEFHFILYSTKVPKLPFIPFSTSVWYYSFNI